MENVITNTKKQMKKIIVFTHNPKNQTPNNPTIKIIPAVQIVELGKATGLTLGGSGNRNEYARPNAKFQGF